MAIPRIYEETNLQVGQTLTLTKSTAQHVHVLRLKAGEEIILFNGQGGEYAGKIEALSRKAVTINILNFNPENRTSNTRLHLIQALTRGEKMDLILQKATELGVSEISLVHTEYTNIKFSKDRVNKKLQHWQKILVSACEQCGLNQIPKLNTPVDLTIFLKNTSKLNGIVLHPYHSTPLNPSSYQKIKNLAIAVGPEGGFTDKEVHAMKEKGLHAVLLGPRILRMETACITALSLTQKDLTT